MADQRITELDALTTAESTDILPIVDDPSGSPVTKKITTGNIVSSLKATGAEINTGTEDAKIVTPKAIADSKVFYNVRCKVRLTSNQNITANNEAILAFATKDFDTGGDFDNANYKFTAPVTGYYMIVANVLFNVTADGDRLIARIQKNGNIDYQTQAYSVASSTREETVVVSHLYQLDASDYITISCVNVSNNDSILATGTNLSIHLLST